MTPTTKTPATADGTPSGVPELIPLHRLPDVIPSSRPGKRLALATLYRWVQRGRLSTIKVGGCRYVTPTGLARLFGPDVFDLAVAPACPPANRALRAGERLDQLMRKGAQR